MSQEKYRLKTGKAGEEQLDNLDRMFGEESRKFLSRIGIEAGMQVGDIGCGIGNLSCWLAEQVGPEGHVYAIDNSAEQLEVAKERAEKRGLTNISFHQADAHDLSQFNDQFDLTYCRWLLVHLKDPAAAVKSMANTVRANGILACEVGDMRLNYYYPSFSAYEDFFEKSAVLLKKSGCDPDICLNVFRVFKSIDAFSDIQIALSQSVITDEAEIENFESRVCVLVDSLSDSLVEMDVMTKEEIELLKTKIQQHQSPEDAIVFLSRMTQIYAKKVS